jgi:hypothetical protein
LREILRISKDCNNKEIEITIMDYVPINLKTFIYHHQLLINIDGDIQMAINNLDNNNSDVLEQSSVLFIKPFDLNKNRLIMYDNWDGNASFQYKISQITTGSADNVL